MTIYGVICIRGIHLTIQEYGKLLEKYSEFEYANDDEIADDLRDGAMCLKEMINDDDDNDNNDADDNNDEDKIYSEKILTINGGTCCSRINGGVILGYVLNEIKYTQTINGKRSPSKSYAQKLELDKINDNLDREILEIATKLKIEKELNIYIKPDDCAYCT